MTVQNDPEIGRNIVASGFATNYLEQGEGTPVVLLHGSGPGVTAFANWRLTIPDLAKSFRVLAPDAVGFGYTDRSKERGYGLDVWTRHILGFLDALGIEKAHLVGNSFGGGLALAIANRHPDRVGKLVLMGSTGISFPLTAGLDSVWGYEPSLESMKGLMSVFAFDQGLVSDEIVQSRYQASVRPGFQESFSQMFPAPRQQHIESMSTPEADIAALPHQALIIHGRDDKVIPLENGIRLAKLIKRSELHVFGQCGHWTQIEKRARFNRLVHDFLLED
ncbi:MAG: alpha/beta hydrolase fold protein [Sphingomonadales bacterium]|nr:alpha/beta hydrolase fold protein [Sphingomonadales bacterium]